MSDSNILLVEHQNLENTTNYIRNGNDITRIKKSSRIHLSFLYIKNFFKEVLLPCGYPNSVSEDYLEYQIWDTAQAFCSTITGAFTTRAILQSVGVGNAEATALSAAVTWILKDGSGMIGRIFFAWWKGNFLDSECKKWRLFADILNDSAMIIELILPIFSSHSMEILCITSTMKSIVGITGGATRASITHHQAIKDNMAEISAKDGTQETVVNLVASFVSIYLLSVITSGIGDTNTSNESSQLMKFILAYKPYRSLSAFTGNPFILRLQWTFILTLMFLHLLTNYLAVKALIFKNFNDERFALIVKSYFNIGTVLNPQKANEKETVFLGFGLQVKEFCGYTILIGRSIKKGLGTWKVADLEQLIWLHKNKEYFLLVDNDSNIIYVSFEEDKPTKCILKAYFHAVCLGIATSIYNGNQLGIFSKRQLHHVTPITRLYTFMKSYEKASVPQNLPYHYLKDLDEYVETEYEMFRTALELNDWNLNSHSLSMGEWKLQWKNVKKKDQ